MSSDNAQMFCLGLMPCTGGGGGGGAATMPDLSYEEQEAGYRDENGDKVYVKSINFGTLPNQTDKAVPHGIANLKDVVGDRFRWRDANAYYVGNVTQQTYLFCWYTRENVNVRTNNNYSGRTATITMYYTCTDR